MAAERSIVMAVRRMRDGHQQENHSPRRLELLGSHSVFVNTRNERLNALKHTTIPRPYLVILVY